MKQTTFEFGLYLLAPETAAQISLVKESLVGLKGVDHVDVLEEASRCTIRVHAEFGDSGAAKKLHRKVMQMLVKREDVSIAYTRSNLTDVFD